MNGTRDPGQRSEVDSSTPECRDPLPISETGSSLEKPEMHTIISLYVITILAIISFNLLIILTIFRSREFRKTPTYLYIASLAVADLCIGALVIPAKIIAYFPEGVPVWLVCRLCEFFAHTAKAARVICMLTITTNRFRTHLDPPRPEVTIRACRNGIIIGWFASAIYAVRAPIIYDLVPQKIQNGGEVKETFLICMISPKYWPAQKILVLIDFTFMHVLPLFVVYGMNIFVIVKVNAKLYSDKKARNSGKSLSVLLMILMALFIITKLPLQVLNLYVNWGPGWFPGSVLTIRIAELVHFANSWLSFIVIISSKRDFRNALVQFICQTCRRQRRIISQD